MKRLLSLFLLVIPFTLFSQRDSVYIKTSIFDVMYSEKLKEPLWVKYLVKCPEGSASRSGMDFYTNDSVITSTNVDYAHNEYDKGHMAPDGDLSWDQQVEYESFLMTNMAPQAGSLNRGIWKLLETEVRGWAVQLNQPYTIYVGGIYNAQDKKIGNGVIVPHAFYKIVINNTTKQIAGWAFPHVAPYPNLGNDLTKFRVPVAEIQKQSGIAFKFPQGAVELQPGQEWAVDFGGLTNSKRKVCGVNATVD